MGKLLYLFIIRILIIIKNKFRNVNYMWRIPNLNDLDVDKETKKLMAKSIYWGPRIMDFMLLLLS